MRDFGHEMLGKTIVLAAQGAAVPYDTGRIANDSQYVKELVADIIGQVHRNELECLQEIIGEALCTIEDPSDDFREFCDYTCLAPDVATTAFRNFKMQSSMSLVEWWQNYQGKYV